MRKYVRRGTALAVLGSLFFAALFLTNGKPQTEEVRITEQYFFSPLSVSASVADPGGKGDSAQSDDAHEAQEQNTYSAPVQDAPKAPVQEKRIALTFDDGPNPVTTLRLLDGLKERGVRATFFLVGDRVERFPEVVRRIAADGHLIGSHTYSHVKLTSMRVEDARVELATANEVIFRVCGHVVIYVRPPYGLWSNQLGDAIDMIEVGWNIDPEDWKLRNTEAIARAVVSRAIDGGIILLHDLYDTSVDAAFAIIDRLKADGWEFVTVDDLILD